MLFLWPNHKLKHFAKALESPPHLQLRFLLSNHDMLVLFPRFLSSGQVFPLSGPPWISAAFLHCTVQQHSPRGRERNALRRLGTDTEQARLDSF